MGNLLYREIDAGADEFYHLAVTRHTASGGDGATVVVEFNDESGELRTQHVFDEFAGVVAYDTTFVREPEGEGREHRPVANLTPTVLRALAKAGLGIRVDHSR